MDVIKNMYCYDVDKTIFNGYTQKFLIDYLYKEKKINFLFKIVGFVWFFLYKLGLVKNLSKPINYLLRVFKNMSLSEYNQIFEDFFIKYIKNQIYQKAINTIIENKKNGSLVILVSTSLEPIIYRVSRYINADYFISTKVLFYKDICQGVIDGVVVDGQIKMNLLKNYLDKINKHSYEKIYFYSDSYSDLPLLEFVSNPCVVNPDKKLYKVAKKYNWPIVKFN